MRILIDSNRFIDFCAGEPSVVDAFEQAALLVVRVAYSSDTTTHHYATRTPGC